MWRPNAEASCFRRWPRVAGVWRTGPRVSGWGQDVAQSLSWYLARVRAGLLMLRLHSECVECTKSCLGGRLVQ